MARPARSLITIVMNILVVLAIAVVASIVIQFFGALGNTTLGEAYVRVASLVTLPLGIESIKTPYGGVFDVDAAITVTAYLAAEWVLSLVRREA